MGPINYNGESIWGYLGLCYFITLLLVPLLKLLPSFKMIGLGGSLWQTDIICCQNQRGNLVNPKHHPEPTKLFISVFTPGL